MLIIVESKKSLKEVCDAVPLAAQKYQFGVLGIHDLKETMAKKGVTFNKSCFIFEVCNPHQAKKVLESHMEVSTVLPCRISVYQQGDTVKLATMKPTAMISAFDAPDLASVALEVEQAIVAIIQEAAD